MDVAQDILALRLAHEGYPRDDDKQRLEALAQQDRECSQETRDSAAGLGRRRGFRLVEQTRELVCPCADFLGWGSTADRPAQLGHGGFDLPHEPSIACAEERLDRKSTRLNSSH